MAWDGDTPVTEEPGEVTPVERDRCSCGMPLVMVADENPPLTQEEINIQFHCLLSRDGWWFFCMTQQATWLRHSPEPS
jgi:hypothetical protein